MYPRKIKIENYKLKFFIRKGRKVFNIIGKINSNYQKKGGKLIRDKTQYEFIIKH